MKTVLVFLTLLIYCGIAAASACTSTGGNASLTATWNCGHVPVAGDTAEVLSGTVTNPSGNTITVGPGTGSFALTVDSGAAFINQGKLVLQGDLDINGTFTIQNTGGTIPAGQVVMRPTSGLGAINPGTSSQFNMTGTDTGHEATINFDGTGGGTGFYLFSGGNGQFNFNYAQWNNCGTSGVGYCATWNGGGSISYIMTHTQLLNSYNFSLIPTTGAVIVTVDSTDVRNCFIHCIDFEGTTAVTTGSRTLTNLTCYGPPGNTPEVDLNMINLKVGASIPAGDAQDIPGMYIWNCIAYSGRTAAGGNTFRRIIELHDGTADDLWEMQYQSDDLLQDSIIYTHKDNPHMGNVHEAQRVIFDSDYFHGTDDGDFYPANGDHDLLIAWCCNAPQLAVAGAGITKSFTNNTIYDAFESTEGEAPATANDLGAFYNNLYVHTGNSGGAFPPAMKMLGQSVRQNSQFTWDYNYIWQAVGSGDPGANSGTIQYGVFKLLSDGTPSGLGVQGTGSGCAGASTCTPNAATEFTADPTSTTSTVVCPGGNCTFTGVQVGDIVWDTVNNNTAVVTAVNGSASLSVSGLASSPASHLVDVKISWWAATTSSYGQNTRGLHDVHANPQFVDSTRNMCAWWNLVAPDTQPCSTHNHSSVALPGIGAQIMKLNGFDINGNPAAYNNAYNEVAAQQWVSAGFVPQNLALHNSGFGGIDIGAVPVSLSQLISPSTTSSGVVKTGVSP